MTPQERIEWLEHPYTKHLIGRVDEVIREIKDDWASDKFADSEKSDAYARGRVHGLYEFFEIE